MCPPIRFTAVDEGTSGSLHFPALSWHEDEPPAATC
jgi:hypothetical protein